jgi:tRNA A-37 threonylcarbamoyl transferase component Bud32/tetratricopeptide (TPR) repeat protein
MPKEQPAGQGDPWIGRIIAEKFRMDTRIGAGAMGSIYKAEHLSLGKIICIKVLHEHLSGDPSLSRRFHREARAASRLKHPNAINIIDFGSTEDNVHYIAMDFVDGQDLAHLIHKDFPLDPMRTLHLLDQIASALDEAHAQGIIHRDLKPENIMVEDRRHQKDFAVVLDFGIAKIKDGGPGSGDSFATIAGMVCGTPEYMSPEQARGEVLDARSDLYSLGVILYQMNTKKLPFTAATPIGVVTKHLTETPVNPRELNPDIHPAMEQLILALMAKDRNRRPASAMEVKRFIETVRNAILRDPSGTGAAPSDAGLAGAAPAGMTPGAASTPPGAVGLTGQEDGSGLAGAQQGTSAARRLSPVPPPLQDQVGGLDDEDGTRAGSRGRLLLLAGLGGVAAVLVALVLVLWPTSTPVEDEPGKSPEPQEVAEVVVVPGPEKDVVTGPATDVKPDEAAVTVEFGVSTAPQVVPKDPVAEAGPSLNVRAVEFVRALTELQTGYVSLETRLDERRKAWEPVDPAVATEFGLVLQTSGTARTRLRSLQDELERALKTGAVPEQFEAQLVEARSGWETFSAQASGLLARELPRTDPGTAGDEQIASFQEMIAQRLAELDSRSEALRQRGAQWRQAKNAKRGGELEAHVEKVAQLSAELRALSQGVTGENVTKRRDDFNLVLGKAAMFLAEVEADLAEEVTVVTELTEQQKRAMEQRRAEIQRKKLEDEQRRQEQEAKRRDEDARRRKSEEEKNRQEEERKRKEELAKQQQDEGQQERREKAAEAEKLGDQANREGKYPVAIMYYKEALRLRPSASLHKKLGQTYNSSGDNRNGAIHLRKYLEMTKGKLSEGEVKMIEAQIRD